ncbi:hypothetical protein SBOR_9539 [Sclerotinia borealis F-4128]|uniref:Myb-like DNA-binding domain-containing protein n=1 Tax=Sclerotinia borealis (strain F-4128) TaxID=1432307 RepID=W9C672_SCLBF|nr:hypothetical protein SBOR_9539 [Sclerotinia borealis F-4128]
MAPVSNEEQFKFLISCIRYSNNGKVDFGQVAKECKIVTKGAAAKRYERMMRSHGIAPNAASIKPAPGSSSGSSSAPISAARNKPSSGRKRKYSGEEENMDDEEESSNQSSIIKNKMKKEIKGEMRTHANVKEEADREDSPSTQLQEGLQMGLGAGLCDVNRELVGYYSDGGISASGGSVHGDADGLEYGDVVEYAGVEINASGINAGSTGAFNQQQTGYTFNTSGYGGMMSGHGMMGNGMGSHGGHGHNMVTPRSHGAGQSGMGMGTQQFQTMSQSYGSQGGSESPLLVD